MNTIFHTIRSDNKHTPLKLAPIITSNYRRHSQLCAWLRSASHSPTVCVPTLANCLCHYNHITGNAIALCLSLGSRLASTRRQHQSADDPAHRCCRIGWWCPASCSHDQAINVREAELQTCAQHNNRGDNVINRPAILHRRQLTETHAVLWQPLATRYISHESVVWTKKQNVRGWHTIYTMHITLIIQEQKHALPFSSS